MKSFSQLKKNLSKDFSDLKPVRIAVLGDTSTQLLTQALRGTGFDYGFDLHVFEGDFNQIEQQVFNPDSELHEFNPEVILIFYSSHKLLIKYNKLKIEQQISLAECQLALINKIVNALDEKLNATIISYNYPEINDSVFGNFANKIESSFLFQLRKLNYELMQFATEHSNFHVCDMCSIQNATGKNTMFQTAVYVNSEMVLSIDILPEVALKTLDIIGAINGKLRKCVIVDLDNTMWGGIIGDDGLENIQLGSLGIGKAFTEFQYWLKKLKNRGIIIAVCSKNTEAIAKEPFEKHPDMVIRLSDIAAFVVNWENKVDNIRFIQSILNIGFDSMVFLDDNPFERNMVRETIPEITVPELPEDPADYLEYLYSLNLFETATFSGEDFERTKQYQIQAQRNVVQKSYANEEEYLQSLQMISCISPFNKFNIPRVAQLSQRSNQFNLRTVRYTEAEVESISTSPEFFTLTFTLEDKFGDNGLICVVILKKESDNILFIDTWLMSCRVLKRGMEHFVLNTIVEKATENGFKRIVGEYIPTLKNSIVMNHYKNLGFEETGKFRTLYVDAYTPKKNHIKLKT